MSSLPSDITNTTDNSAATSARTDSPPTEEQLKEWRCNLMLTMACRIAVFRADHPETSRSEVWRTATDNFQEVLYSLESAEDFERARVSMEEALDFPPGHEVIKGIRFMGL